jgi:hypothetical protein
VKKLGLFVFNVLLAVWLAGLYTWAVVERRPTSDALEAAFATSWWAGLTVGLSVAAGAVLGPRPVLGWKKCIRVQVLIVLSSALFALLMWLLPRELTEMDRVVEQELAKRGLRLGSGIGAALMTAYQVIDVYLKRRRAARPK